MRKFIVGCCLASLLTLTSCVNIIEEIFLKKDGSGNFKLTLDLSSIISMKDMLMGEMAGNKKDPTSFLGENFDSLIYFTDMKDSVRRTLLYPELIERAHLRLKGDEAEGVMTLTLEFPFNNIEEINQFQSDIHRHGNDSINKKIDPGFLGYQTKLSSTKKSIERKTIFTEPIKETGEEEENNLALMSRMMFSTARIKTIYHLPGKVKKTTIKDAIVRGNQCEIELTYPEFISGKKSLDGAIIFK